MHAVDHTAVGRQNDWESQVGFANHPCVLHYRPTRGVLRATAKPMRFVNLPNA